MLRKNGKNLKLMIKYSDYSQFLNTQGVHMFSQINNKLTYSCLKDTL